MKNVTAYGRKNVIYSCKLFEFHIFIDDKRKNEGKTKIKTSPFLTFNNQNQNLYKQVSKTETTQKTSITKTVKVKYPTVSIPSRHLLSTIT